MNRSLSCLFLAGMLGLAVLSGSRPLHAQTRIGQLRTVDISGDVFGFDPDQGLLNVNTRLGPRNFLVTPSTVVLVNGRPADAQDLLPDDPVTISYRFDTSEARIIRVKRTTRGQGTVVAIGNNTLDLRIRGGDVLRLTLDEATRTRLAGVGLTSPAVLTGMQVKTVYDPVTRLVLSVDAPSSSASTTSGRITVIDPATQTLTVAGRRTSVFTVDPNATILLNGQSVEFSELKLRDQISLAFTRSGAANRALLIQLND